MPTEWNDDLSRHYVLEEGASPWDILLAWERERLQLRPLPEVPSITCPGCQMTSYHPEDVRHGWCGNCHAFTSAPGPPPRPDPG